MQMFSREMRQTLLPDRGAAHGPLPPLLVALTFVTGLVDAFSYLATGHVFVANMTGNVVLLGFALAGAPGFAIAASMVALVAFWCGALVGGRVGVRYADHRGRLLCTAAVIQALFLAVAVILAALSGSPIRAAWQYPLVAVLALAMGVQNSVARKLAVPDLTTTVLTLTITGIAADSAIAGGTGSHAGRRLIAVAAMLLGAFIGALFVRQDHSLVALVCALIVIIGVALLSWSLGKSDPAWVRTAT